MGRKAEACNQVVTLFSVFRCFILRACDPGFGFGHQVDDRRHVAATAVPIVQRQVDADTAGHGEQVDDGIGRATDGAVGDDRILERFLGQDVAGEVSVPYPFKSATEMLEYCNSTGLSLSGMAMQNELALHSKKEIEEYFGNVWQTMQACIDRGMNTEGVLPGPLRVPRRASALRRMLVSSDKLSNDPMNVIDWVNMFALAVNEENAAGGRVVTAPTNGACGIVPAVLAYYDHFIESVSPDIYTRYFLAAGAIKGGTVKVTGIGRNSMQGDIRFADVLEKMGATITWGDDFIACTHGELNAVDMDMNHIPDAAMTIATAALFAKGTTTLRNIYNWRVKETDRLFAMATELRKVGAEVEEGHDFIRITPPATLQFADIATYNDHRMAMCFSLVALSDTPVTILDPKCTAKTFPDYFEQLARISTPA